MALGIKVRCKGCQKSVSAIEAVESVQNVLAHFGLPGFKCQCGLIQVIMRNGVVVVYHHNRSEHGAKPFEILAG